MNLPNLKIVLAIACVITFIACQQPAKQSEKYKLAELEREDKQFLALKDTAQNHINEFVTGLEKNKLDTNYRFMVKSDFIEGQTHEHMWSVILNFKENKFYGLLADSAYNLKNIKTGDKVIIHKEDVEDWAIFDYEHQTEKGNFSDKYLRSKMK
ncbi:DUF2314 domain-containing protein [Mucilaginibacter sp. UR6-1]|uniref:DUF2314 domain-containing protein n=1 Tax=Mucilaginibacter sp. UR6-1 TaxID=1435643 RepID=UPI001E3637E9|nr:DUF2314 domain-containing protein [Mucilaginibacter sp. UR6-1]MCC8409718.1 DUF2314 domain-containing protein [Mucilaginibacter sp. UR6-1]